MDEEIELDTKQTTGAGTRNYAEIEIKQTKKEKEDTTEDKRERHLFGVQAEWKGFSLKAFFTGLIFSVLPAFFDSIVDNLLGWEYIVGSEQFFLTGNSTSIPGECQTIENLNFTSILDEYQLHENSTIFAYTCRTQANVLFGIITIAIPFLPGIQWYASLKTERSHAFWKFITSLFFPFFMLFFKVGLHNIYKAWLVTEQQLEFNN